MSFAWVSLVCDSGPRAVDDHVRLRVVAMLEILERARQIDDRAEPRS
jgi:hypothetical protein